MERELINYKIENLGTNDFFKVEFINQDVMNKPEFKKWYENIKEVINKENLEREKDLLTIGFCIGCMSYTICSIMDYSYCFVICNKCKKTFCVGCLQDNNSCFNIADATICLKGFMKIFYLRIIYRRSDYERIKYIRSDYERTRICFQIMHIFFCLFMTPLYLGFLSNMFGLYVHPNKNRRDDINKDHLLYQLIYSIARGLLMFPYIILFFPFMVILLLPGIFSYRYYLYIYNAYITALLPGPHKL